MAGAGVLRRNVDAGHRTVKSARAPATHRNRNRQQQQSTDHAARTFHNHSLYESLSEPDCLSVLRSFVKICSSTPDLPLSQIFDFRLFWFLTKSLLSSFLTAASPVPLYYYDPNSLWTATIFQEPSGADNDPRRTEALGGADPFLRPRKLTSGQAKNIYDRTATPTRASRARAGGPALKKTRTRLRALRDDTCLGFCFSQYLHISKTGTWLRLTALCSKV